MSKQTISYQKKGHCKYCRDTENLTIDHKVPLCQGGSNTLSNYQTLCKFCNETKSGLSHKQVMYLWAWHDWVNKKRWAVGKNAYTTIMRPNK